MPIITDIIRFALSYRLRAIDDFKAAPYKTQQDVFERLMVSLSHTTYGKEHGITDRTTYSEYASKMPVVTYEEIEPYITSMRKGEDNILWDTPVKWFSRSSGTTNDKSKFIPVTEEGLQRCHFMGGRDVIAMTAERYPETNLFNGKQLTIGGSHNIETLSDKGIRYGDISAIMISNIPSIVAINRLPTTEIALISDFNKKVDLICKTCYDKNVTIIAGVPSWNLVMLNKVLEYTGKDNISEVWPNLEMFFHGGICFSPYEKEYKKMIPSSNMKYTDTYNASEGFFALQDDPLDKSLLLMLDYGVFYEFIPMSNIEDRTKTIPLEGVQCGVNYAMVISSINGLWRYLIGDTVTFTSTSPYKILITGRTKLFINAFGEEVIIDNAEKAISKACEATNSVIFEYTAAPVYMSCKTKGRHQWAIEFKKEPSDIDLFTKTLDTAIQELNSDYQAKRDKDTTLLLPIITMLKKGTFIKWLERRGKLGGQNKIPRLSNDRKHIDDLLAI
ncbi:MAG: GH3 auxin-responsive promoter family protein [Rikenellaceae bacterium]